MVLVIDFNRIKFFILFEYAQAQVCYVGDVAQIVGREPTESLNWKIFEQRHISLRFTWEYKAINKLNILILAKSILIMLFFNNNYYTRADMKYDLTFLIKILLALRLYLNKVHSALSARRNCNTISYEGEWTAAWKMR